MQTRRTALALITSFIATATVARESGPRPDAQTRADVLKVREAAWRSWFGNDAAGFNRAVPNELVAFNWSGGPWQDKEQVLQGMQEFARSGTRLTSLEFPENAFQKYGDTVILYSQFRVVLADAGKTQAIRGRATEVFVRRRGRWIHTGWHLEKLPPAS